MDFKQFERLKEIFKEIQGYFDRLNDFKSPQRYFAFI